MIKHIPPLSPASAETGAIPRILIVDDDETHLEFIKAVILKEELNCELTLCSSAEEALEFVGANPVELVLLDVMMPGMDGTEMNRRLKEKPQTAAVPVIFLTSSRQTEALVQAYESGAVDFISKPVNAAVLMARMQGILRRISLENELTLRNQELEQINRFKDELLSVCSHDLRAPLAAIEVICQVLGESLGPERGAEAGRQVDKIVNQSRLARRLVENLLHYHKIEEGMLVPAPSFFEVRELLATCAEQEQPMVQVKGLALRTGLPEEEIVAFGDRELLAQAVRNILGNATKYAKSTISMAATVRDMTGEGGGRLHIAITDDGPGIEPEMSGQIFQKYAKADPCASGSGLGLYIASKAVEAQGGTIEVTSHPGHATTFGIELPHAYFRGQLPDLSAVNEARGVVVSASTATAELLESVLLEAGMLYVDNHTGDADGPALLEPDRPAFVVVDLEKPAFNVFDLVKLINGAGKDIHWIFYGAAGKVDSIAKSLQRPCARLAPPLNPLVYLDLIGGLLQGKGGANATVTV